MLLVNTKSQKLLFLIILGAVLFLAFIRIVLEENQRHYSFAMNATDLYRYYSFEKSPPPFQKYIKILKKNNLNFLFVQPSSLKDFIFINQIQIIKTESSKTILLCPKKLWAHNLLKIEPTSIKPQNENLEITFPYFYKDIIKLPFNYAFTHIPNIKIIKLKKKFYKKSIDGWMNQNEIFYSPKNFPSDLKSCTSIFQPFEFINSDSKVFLQYKRAFWERKNSILIIPFFSKLLKKKSNFSLIDFIKTTNNKIDNPSNFSFFLNENWFLTAFKILLIFSLAFFFLKNPIFALLFSFLSLFIDLVPLINNLYIVFIALFFYGVLIQYLLTNKYFAWADFFLIIIIGALTLSGLGTTSAFLNKTYVPHFVTLFFVLGISILLYVLYKQKFYSFVQNTNFTDLFFIFFIPVVGYIFLIRTHNIPHIPSWEISIRNGLEKLLFIRPRLKEAFFFYPLLTFGLLALPQKLLPTKFLRYIIAIGSLGIISSFNTITHFQTFFLFSFSRMLLGILIGSFLGWILFLSIKLLFYIKKVLNA